MTSRRYTSGTSIFTPSVLSGQSTVFDRQPSRSMLSAQSLSASDIVSQNPKSPQQGLFRPWPHDGTPGSPSALPEQLSCRHEFLYDARPGGSVAVHHARLDALRYASATR